MAQIHDLRICNCGHRNVQGNPPLVKTRKRGCQRMIGSGKGFEESEKRLP